MRHFRRHADALAQRGVGVDGLANVHAVRTHLNRQGNLANHVARMGADNAAAQDAVGLRIKRPDRLRVSAVMDDVETRIQTVKTVLKKLAEK